MDINRNPPPLSAVARPLPPQRALSGSGLQYPKQPSRPNHPSRLSSVRSASQPANLVDLTSDGESRSNTPFGLNKESAVASPVVIDLDDNEGEPPAKKVKLAETASRVEGEDTTPQQTDRAHQSIPGSPLPSLPRPNQKARTPSSPRRMRTGESTARHAEGKTPPSIAVRIPAPKSVADFSPWTGHHPEDVLTETVIKGGYFDKGPGNSSAESNSAKASIWPNLSQKNNMGLQTLSYLYAQVMEKRQVFGKCTAPSTFKPPPRVTVTDTKREAWLRDLANPDIPLRKQSRTIPHGIRGKVLMEQCLGKDIPLPRAVWLAKCVGANELRAFRRKGVSGPAAASGEIKWVREWTISVEQFVEGVIASCGQPDWQLRMNYAVKLATSFYVEKLLDADHYLDWIVSSLSESNAKSLPIWIVMAQIYWKDIAAFVRRGRKLAENILERLYSIQEENSDSNELLKSRLQKLVTVLATTNRGCLIIPQTWEKYKHLLTPKPNGDPIAENIATRNERLWGPLRKTPANTKSPLLDLYTDLDTAGLSVNTEKLVNKCLAVVSDINTIVPALLDWASTPYRQGVSRVYLASRIISELYNLGHDTDSAILRYLGDTSRSAVIKVDYLYKVIVQLVRWGGFSVGRYLQWLITSGVMSDEKAPARATGLLVTLPTEGLPRHLQSTRKMLLQRLGSEHDPTGPIEKSTTELEAAFVTVTSSTYGPTMLPEGISPPVKTAMAGLIHGRIQKLAEVDGISLGSFCLLRDYLEILEDLPVMAELLDAAMSSGDLALLATATDTINMHAESLAALDRLDSLSDRITERYRSVRSQQVLDRTFIISLASFVKRLDKLPLMKLLQHDLAVCDQQTSVMACSPASDNLIGMHASKLDSDNDIDAVFASGNSMDQQLMQRVFSRIVLHSEKSRFRDDEPVSKVCRWLRQLRALDSTGFDQLAAQHLKATIESSVDDTASTTAVTCLVASGCVAISSVAGTATQASSSLAAASALDLLLSPDAASSSLHAAEKYRYHLMQSRYRADSLESIMGLLHSACKDAEFEVDKSWVIDLLVESESRERTKQDCAFDQSARDDTVLANADRLCRAMMRRSLPDFEGEVLDPTSIFTMADPLSVRFSTGLLRFYLVVQTSKGLHCDGVMYGLLVDAVEAGNPVWPQLLEVVSAATKKSLYEWAEEQLLFASAHGPREEREEDPPTDLVDRYLEVMDVTKSFAANKEDATALNTITEKLRDIERQLTDDGMLMCEDSADTERLLYILLHICILQVQTAPVDSDTIRTARGQLLITLCSLLVHPKLQTQQDTTEYIFDLASTLADSLPDAVMAHIPRSGPQALSRDPRIDSILGCTANAAQIWLGLASQSLPGGTQQQRALNKHPSQQIQGRTGIPGPATGGAQPTQRANWPPVKPEVKITPYPLRKWEIIPDPTPVMGENDTSLSLGLFAARKV